MKWLSQFGRRYLETLRAHRPRLYQDLTAAGELYDHVHGVDTRANATFQELIVAMQNAHPLPQNSEERSQAMFGIASQAREIVMNEILVRDEQTERAELLGGYE